MKNRIANRMTTLSPSLTLAISAKAKAMKAAGESVVSFGVGEPDFNTPEHIINAAKVALDKGHTKYTPSSGLLPLRKAICEKFEKDNGLSYEPSQIIVSNGAKHSIFNACYAILEEGDEVIIPAPYWLTYPEVVKVCGATPVYLPCKKENKFKFSAEELKAAITPKTKMLIFNSPSNPTGSVYGEEEVRAIAKVCEEAEIFVLSDEIYEKLCYNGVKPFSIAKCSEKMKDLTIVINGVSKTYAMTGWRVGYLAAPKDIAKAIDSFQSHATSNACSISQYATIEALASSEEEIQAMVNVFDARREKLLKLIADIDGVTAVEPDGAFYVMLVVGGLYGKNYQGKVIDNSIAFADALLEAEKVATVPGVSFGADDCVRLSYALSEADMEEGLRRIKRFVEALS
ncbi:MAG: pyridoxal phosphate-dependent aminotransferase [Clostridiales bacterium]|nr:pyridoxal phosphate-dependent aminotransferase [Clostridiales bacterium]